MIYWVAFDVGAKGAMCVLDSAVRNAVLLDFDKVGLKGYATELQRLIDKVGTGAITVLIEKVHAMPKQGVSSMFNFGVRYGELLGLTTALELSTETVPPQEWQKGCGIPTKSGKIGVFNVIQRIYPQATLRGPKGGLLDGRVDALSMAHYLSKKPNRYIQQTFNFDKQEESER